MTVETPEQIKKNRMSNAVSIAVVLFAVIASVSKIKDDNIVQAMQLAKINAVDTWSEYQAKKLKLHLAEIAQRQAVLLQNSMPEAKAEKINAEIDFQNQAIQNYETDLTSLQSKAKEFEAGYDALNFHDDQFDMSDALLSLAMALIAVSSLVERWSVFFVGLSAGLGGTLFSLAGFFGWAVHPDWLARLLS